MSSGGTVWKGKETHFYIFGSITAGTPLQFLSASQQFENQAGKPSNPSQSSHGASAYRSHLVNPCVVASACSWGAEIIAGHYPFTTSDLKDVRIVASTGGPEAAFDVRVADLRIRAESLPAQPQSAAALNGEGVPRRMWWLFSLLAIAVVLAVGLTLRRLVYRRG